MRRFLLAAPILIVTAAWGAPALAQDKYASADAAATQAAAVRALPGKILPIVGRSLAIVGVSTGLEAVLEDLHARVTAQEIAIELSADVLFDFDKADLRPEAAGELGKVAQVLTAHPGAPVTIEGHTDAKGNDAYNQGLSERRAASVKAWLVANGGAAADAITTRGRGETEPVAPNAKPDGSDDPEGRQKNRRVEITVRTAG
jgi:photosystem I P700 chlorophyll a apoprotein A2